MTDPSAEKLARISPEEARRSITAVDGLDLRSHSIDELKECLRPVFTGYATYFRQFQPGLHLYRAVKWAERPANVAQLTYPPKERTSLSRANRASAPLFYGSIAARSATLFEQRLAVGDSVAIGLWESTAPIAVAQLGHLEDVFRLLRAVRQPHWKFEPRDPGSSIVDEWLSRRFCERVSKAQEQKYNLTTAIAEKFLDSSIFEGILYPSLEMRASADNIGLKPPVADSKLRLISAEFLVIDEVSQGVLSIRSLDFAREVADDGTIVWSGEPSPTWRFPGLQRFWRVGWTQRGWQPIEWRPPTFEPH